MIMVEHVGEDAAAIIKFPIVEDTIVEAMEAMTKMVNRNHVKTQLKILT